MRRRSILSWSQGVHGYYAPPESDGDGRGCGRDGDITVGSSSVGDIYILYLPETLCLVRDNYEDYGEV